MPRNKKAIFSDESDDDFPHTSGKRCDIFGSDYDDDDVDDEDEADPSSRKKYPAKGKKKHGFIGSDSSNDDDNSNDEDDDSFENFPFKTKKDRRGIIESESESDDDDSSSSDREEGPDSENLCPICLAEFEEQMVGIPEHCKHVFCIECLKEWSKNVNNCPVDRKKFNKITIKDMHGKVVDELIVEDVKTADVYEDPPTYCQVCRECDREDCMLLCDGCDDGYHMDCLSPALECVPLDEWLCIECAPPTEPKPTTSRSRSRRTQEDVDESSSSAAVEHLMNTVYARMNAAAGGSTRQRNSGGRTHAMFGESRTTGQARTVASNRQNTASRASAIAGRSRFVQATKKLKNTKTKKRRRRSRRKKNIQRNQKNQKKKKEEGDEEVHDDELTNRNRPRIFGDPFDLNELYDPGDEEEMKPTPIRSTIVDTPDVVGHILGFSTLDSEVVVARDGTLKPKPADKPSSTRTKSPTSDRKRKIRFTLDSDENDDEIDNDDHCDSDDNLRKDSKNDILKDKRSKKKRVIIDDENADERHTETSVKSENVDTKTLSTDEGNDRSEETKTKIKTEQLLKHVKSETKIEDSKKKTIINTSGTILNKAKTDTDNTQFDDDGTKVKREESDKFGECSKHNDSSHKRRNVRFADIEEKDHEKRSTLLTNMRKRLKATMEKKSREIELQNECKKMRAASDEIDIKTDSSLLNVASFKIPKLKKKNNEETSGSSSNQDQDTDSNENKNICRKNAEIKEKTVKMDKVDSLVKDSNENKNICRKNAEIKEKTVKMDKVDSLVKDSLMKIDVAPDCHQEGSQKKNLVELIKKEADITRNASNKQRIPLTNLEKKIKLHKEGILSPDHKRQKNTKIGTKKSLEKSDSNRIAHKPKVIDDVRIDHKPSGDVISPPSTASLQMKPKKDKQELSADKDIKKKSISLNAYRNRHVDGSDPEKDKNDTNNKDSTTSISLMNKALFGDTDSDSISKYTKDYVLGSESDPPLDKRINNVPGAAIESKSTVNSNNKSKVSKTLPDPRRSSTSLHNKPSNSHVTSKRTLSCQTSTSLSSNDSKLNSASKDSHNEVKIHVTTDQAYSKYVNPSARMYREPSILDNDIASRNNPILKESMSDTLDSSSGNNSRIRKDSIESKSRDIVEDINSNKDSSSKFDKNSPYSVIRPFQGPSTSTSNTPVAVVSPSMRDGENSSFKFKEKESSHTVTGQQNLGKHQVPSDPRPPRKPSTLYKSGNNSSKNVSNSSSDHRQHHQKPDIDDGITTREKKILYYGHPTTEKINEWKAPSTKESNPYGNEDYIDKVKEYLKPYYKQRLVTKEQWKAVVKTAVRIIHRNRKWFSNDDQIKTLVQKQVAPYLKLGLESSDDGGQWT